MSAASGGGESPYPPPLGPGVVARAVMARSAEHWRADIEARLVEEQLTTELADSVVRWVDAFGCTVDQAISAMRELLALADSMALPPEPPQRNRAERRGQRTGLPPWADPFRTGGP